MDEVVLDIFEKKYQMDASFSLIVGHVNEDDEEILKCLSALNAMHKFLKSYKQGKPLDFPTKVRPHAIEEPPILELISLPSHLKYAYLGILWHF